SYRSPTPFDFTHLFTPFTRLFLQGPFRAPAGNFFHTPCHTWGFGENLRREEDSALTVRTRHVACRPGSCKQLPNSSFVLLPRGSTEGLSDASFHRRPGPGIRPLLS